MAKGAYRYIAEAWQDTKKSGVDDLMWSRLIDWRRAGSFVRVDRPTRLDRARTLGYKAKQGYVIVRTHVRRGGLHKHQFHGGRKARARGMVLLTLDKNLKQVAEERVGRHYPNMEVLNSYWVGEDGKNAWYEIILVDKHHPSVMADKNLNWLCNNANKSRVFRGKTSAGRKGRGLRWKGKGAEKARPSVRAHDHNIK